MEVYFDDDFKFTPSSLCDLIWRFVMHSIWIRVTVVEFEVNLFHIRRHILIVIWPNVSCPLMSMAIFLTFLSKMSSDIAIYNGFDNSDTLQKKWKG